MDFCTYFDRDYMTRGLVLVNSLLTHGDPVDRIWILALDSFTGAFLRQLKLRGVNVIDVDELEGFFPGLLAAKMNRSRVEYFWTLSPFLPYYLMYARPHLPSVCYLDSDMALFSSPSAIWQELDVDAAALLVPHDYSPEYATERRSGRFNVGLMAYNAGGARACLEWWAERCLEWCYARHEDGRFGDQAYLDEWPLRFDNIVVSKRRGLGAAPWNAGKYELGRAASGELQVAGEPLVAYHFHGVRPCVGRLVHVAAWPVELSAEWLDWVYRPYIETLLSAERWAARRGGAIRTPRFGVPVRYALGRIVKREPLRHFLLARKTDAGACLGLAQTESAKGPLSDENVTG